MIDPYEYAKTPTEHAQQVALFMWAALPETRDKHPELARMFAIPNGGERNKIVASRLKAEGVKMGVPDIMLPVARGGYHGLFIEMKRPRTANQPGGTASGQQLIWISSLANAGYMVTICHDFQSAVSTIKTYLAK